MNRAARVTVVFIALSVAVVVCHDAVAAELTGQQQRDVLIEAQQAYDQGIALLRGNPAEARARFEESTQKYRVLVDSGLHNGLLFYNLGNAFLQAGDVGRAIANYRRAEELLPGDPRLRSNLDFARTLCKTPIASSGQRALLSALLRWHDRTATQTRFTVFIVAWVFFWCALLMRVVGFGGAWTAFAALAAAVWLACGISVAVDLTVWGHRPIGVIVADNVTVRKGNGSGFEAQFTQPLGSGVEFSVLERRGDWLNIRLPNDLGGWIQTDQAEVIQ